MATNNNNISQLFLGLAIAAAIGLALIGCRTTPDSAKEANSSNPSPSPRLKPDGATVWADNCSRCHNLRPPSEFSADEWEVVVHHMRVRATLTADETRAIVKFLKAAN